jgi:hypothetical protein
MYTCHLMVIHNLTNIFHNFTLVDVDLLKLEGIRD